MVLSIRGTTRGYLGPDLGGKDDPMFEGFFFPVFFPLSFTLVDGFTQMLRLLRSQGLKVFHEAHIPDGCYRLDLRRND